MKHRPADSVYIETTYNVLRDSILSALEKDSGRFDIADEILRILSIRVKKRNNDSTWAKNFGRSVMPQKHVVRVWNRFYRGK